jgi:NADH-quinone oxidoreductase subunit N
MPSILIVIILSSIGVFINLLLLLQKLKNRQYFSFIVDFGSVLGLNVNERGFFDVMLIDGLAIVSQLLLLVASMLFIPLALTSKRFHEYSYPEFFALFLFMIAGFQFMVSSDNLILIFVGIETSSLALYTLIALHNRDNSYEAAVKYFTMGALAAGFFVMGSAIIYALTGSVEIHKIEEVLIARDFQPIWGVLLGVVFMIAALGFKLSMVPFQTWVPDVYEGASAALAGYMSIVPKIAGFVVAMRLFEFLVHADIVWVQNILWIVAVVTMTATNIMALVQEGVKRMLAYSSVSHAGFAMSAILIGTTQANSALFFYWILFTFTNLGAFTMLWVSRHKGNENGEIQGLITRMRSFLVW